MIVIVPTSRAERIGDVLAQFAAQTYSHAELCVCPAPGMARPAYFPGAWLAGTSSIGAARNLGLAYARNRGHDWAVFWDDDNYYGPDYLAEIAREHADADVLSKGIAFVSHPSGLWLYASRLRFFPGHSTAVRVSEAADFPNQSGEEDMVWSRAMLACEGLRVKHLSPWGLVYNRAGSGHAYDASEVEFLRAHGPARPCPPSLCVDLPAPVVASDEAMFQALARRSKLRGMFT